MARTQASSVSDTSYPRIFHSSLAPAWLDLIATLCGYASPRRDEHFNWCDLGCGPATSATCLAACYPRAGFYGLDAMPVHIDEGKRWAKAARVRNLKLYARTFAGGRRDLPQFDYIVSHGVYSWIDAAARAEWRAFIDRHLKPGGLVYVSYNAMPGWAADLPLQRLLAAAAEQYPGNSAARVDAALVFAETLAKKGAQGLIRSSLVTEAWRRGRESAPLSYFVHEYLAPGWAPRYVTDVRREMADIGLVPVGSARFRENFDRFALTARARGVLATIEDADFRELVRDFMMGQSFRRDIYTRDPKALDARSQRERLLAMRFDLAGPLEQIALSVPTSVGRLSVDHRAGRRLVAELADGARELREIARGDAIATAIGLLAVAAILPVDGKTGTVAPVNQLIVEARDDLNAARELVHPGGAGVLLPARVGRDIARGERGSGKGERWQRYYRSRNMIP
jgi:SAM-dependent methyltransferase